jgi:cytochrome P450
MATTDSSANVSDSQGTATEGAAFPILEALDAIAAGQGDPAAIASAQFSYVLEQIRGNALPFFAEMRDGRPILRTPVATLVARFRDVEEILHREAVFSVSPYLPRMMGVIGPFVLSQDLTQGYDHDISVMRLAVRREDLARVADIVSRHADAIVDDLLRAGGPADIVQTLTRRVPVRLADEYFGFSAADAEMMGWARPCFREFFINLLDDPAVRAPAVAAGAEMRTRLDALLAERRAGGGETRDDVLGRLLCLQAAGDGASLDDDGVRRTLAGLVVGMIETTSQAAVQALLVLFSRPEMLARAAVAAGADDDDALADLVFEALRFSPINPMVVRVAKEDYRLAAGEPHEMLIPRGTTVFALTWSAMFDPQVVEAPEEFRPGRPDYHYLHFATGFHACFGRYVSRIQIPQILKPLLRRKGLRPAGAPEYDGTFPERFLVATDG